MISASGGVSGSECPSRLFFAFRSVRNHERSVVKKYFEFLLISKNDNAVVQFFRYGIVGGIAFAADFGVLFVLTSSLFFQTHYLLAAGISFIAGLLVNYHMSIRWVFSERSSAKNSTEFLVFSVIGLAGLALNAAFIWFFTDVFFSSMIVVGNMQAKILASKIISTVFVFLWNFFARKILLFSGKES
jgi:putative flippase GtrA